MRRSVIGLSAVTLTLGILLLATPSFSASCSANCLFGSCWTSCPAGFIPACGCFLGIFPDCKCIRVGSCLTAEPSDDANKAICLNSPSNESPSNEKAAVAAKLLPQLEMFLEEYSEDLEYTEALQQFLDAAVRLRDNLTWDAGPIPPNVVQGLENSVKGLTVGELEKVRQVWKRVNEETLGGQSTPSHPIKPSS